MRPRSGNWNLDRLTTQTTIRFDEVRAWMFGQALPLWVGMGLDLEHGGSVECLDFSGHDAARPIKRLRVQARQVYAFSHAEILGWDGPARAAADHCWDYLIGRGRREDGAFVRLLNRDGSVNDPTADAYDMAFAINACAWRIKAGDSAAMAVAHHTLDALDGLLGFGPGQGWGAAEDRPHERLLNPHMHLLEATLAWREVEPGGIWDAMADEVAELGLTKLMDRNGAIREFYSADWNPVAGAAGRSVEPGPQIE